MRIKNEPKLTSLAHGGGCGCKVSPEILSDILGKVRGAASPEELLVGLGTSDDAAVYQINESQAIVSTTDFFMPIVDDPVHFGAIAATNALSDVFAMGGKPLFALAIVGMPVNTLSSNTISKILKGGSDICEEAGIVVAGGHTIDSMEPIYGLVVTGLVDIKNLRKNSTACVGDRLILGKKIGVGVYSAAIKEGSLSKQYYDSFIKSTTQLNKIGMQLGELDSVTAMTDVTGFGLLGHLNEMNIGSNTSSIIYQKKILRHDGVEELINQGYKTGASQRNLDAIKDDVQFSKTISDMDKVLLADPQTSGGLLVAVKNYDAESVLNLFVKEGYDASIIGDVVKKTEYNIFTHS